MLPQSISNYVFRSLILRVIGYISPITYYIAKLNQCKISILKYSFLYLNPEGPMGQPIPEHSANEIRGTFARMSMNDSEAVALIGGGHSFGKTHGACNKGAGLSPKLDPENPWPGLCGSGRGEDTYTSGFEFPWTKTPTAWNTEYFQNLILFPWKVGKGPGDRFQWRVEGVSPHARSANGSHRQNIGMLTTDVALLRAPFHCINKLLIYGRIKILLV